MASNQLETAVRDKIKVSDGKQFQQYFWDVMILRYGDLSTPRMQRDLGSDAYSITDGIFFACYAPESFPYDNTKTVKKIDDDFKDFCDNWKDKYPFKQWVFATKENLMGKPHQKIVELNASDSTLLKINWGLEHLTREALSLGDEHLVRIFNLPGAYLATATSDQKDFGIIGEIFDFLFSTKKVNENVLKIKTSSNFTKLEEKVPLNFPDNEVRVITEMIVRNWHHKSLVQEYIAAETARSPERVDALIDMIQSDLRNLANTVDHNNPIGGVQVIENLAKKYIMKEKQLNSDYVAAARGIILYFFELCYLGKKTEQEKEVPIV